MQELRDDLPILALPDLRQGANTTAPGVEAGWSDAQAAVNEPAGALNDGFIRAVQMLITIGAMGNYHEAFSPYDVGSFDRGDLGFYVRVPKIIQDKLSLDQQIQYWLQTGQKRKAWELLGASQVEMDEWEAEEQALQDQYMDSLNAENGNPNPFGSNNEG